MSETLHSRNRVRIAEEMQSGNNAISMLVRAKADTKTNTMRTEALSGLGLNVTVAVGQQKPIATNIKQRIIGTRGKQKGEPMALIETERLLKKIKNEYERAEVARWVNAEKPISITWSDKTARKTKLYCRKSGYLCEFATEYGYCQITVCVKEPLAGRRTDDE